MYAAADVTPLGPGLSGTTSPSVTCRELVGWTQPIDSGNLIVIVQIDPTFGARADFQYVVLHFSVEIDPSGGMVNPVLAGGSAGDFDASDGRRIMIVDPSSPSGTLTGTTGPGGRVTGELTFGLAVSEPISIDPFQAVTHTAIARIAFNDLAVQAD